jgi:hypothetical protein
MAIVLIEQIRKEIKVPWLLLSKRPGEKNQKRKMEKKGSRYSRSLAHEKKKKKKNEHAQNQKRERMEKQDIYAQRDRYGYG